MAGSATYKQSETVWSVLSFKVSLFTPSWKQREFVYLVCWSADEDLCLLVVVSVTKLQNAPLNFLSWHQKSSEEQKLWLDFRKYVKQVLFCLIAAQRAQLKLLFLFHYSDLFQDKILFLKQIFNILKA